MEDEEKQRILAVRRFLAGEKPESHMLLTRSIEAMALQVGPTTF